MKRLFPVILAIIVLSGCNKPGFLASGKKNLRAEIDLIRDSLDTSWNYMIEEDDRKISDIRRLLEEVSYTGNHDSIKVRELTGKTERLKTLRYQQQTMTSAQIDRYDAATDSLLRETFLLIENTPEMEKHSLTQPLIDDIKNADEQVIIRRIRYDSWAKEFNLLLKEKAKKVKRLGAPYSDYRQLPIFELPSGK